MRPQTPTPRGRHQGKKLLRLPRGKTASPLHPFLRVPFPPPTVAEVLSTFIGKVLSGQVNILLPQPRPTVSGSEDGAQQPALTGPPGEPEGHTSPGPTDLQEDIF